MWNPGCIMINQTKFIESCGIRFRVSNSKGVCTLIELKLDLSKSNSVKLNLCVVKFQKLLGCLNYITDRSRPDTNYAVNKLSRFRNVATEEIYKYLL